MFLLFNHSPALYVINNAAGSETCRTHGFALGAFATDTAAHMS
ncbi:hypothetical protein BN133_1788 [Cronobacter dublinensis 582]|nr:hypothetical protein BN133_1788 [Cronobacter dublinensis 582]